MYKYHLKDIRGNILLTSYTGYPSLSEAVKQGFIKSRSLREENNIITTVEIEYDSIVGEIIEDK